MLLWNIILTTKYALFNIITTKNVLKFLGFLSFYKHFPFYLSDSKGKEEF